MVKRVKGGDRSRGIEYTNKHKMYLLNVLLIFEHAIKREKEAEK